MASLFEDENDAVFSYRRVIGIFLPNMSILRAICIGNLFTIIRNLFVTEICLCIVLEFAFCMLIIQTSFLFLRDDKQCHTIISSRLRNDSAAVMST